MTGLVLALSFALLLPSSALGQRTANHEGFWISFGFGGGWSLDDDVFGDTQTGFASQLRMGGTPSQQVLVGGEAIGWTTTEVGTDLARGNAHLIVMYYPSPRGGLFLKGGIGFAGSTADLQFVPGDVEPDGGFGFGAALGYDIQVASNFFLTPTVDFVYQGISDNSASLLLLTINAMWH
jgi:hypothetical protein